MVCAPAAVARVGGRGTRQADGVCRRINGRHRHQHRRAHSGVAARHDAAHQPRAAVTLLGRQEGMHARHAQRHRIAVLLHALHVAMQRHAGRQCTQAEAGIQQLGRQRHRNALLAAALAARRRARCCRQVARQPHRRVGGARRQQVAAHARHRAHQELAGRKVPLQPARPRLGGCGCGFAAAVATTVAAAIGGGVIIVIIIVVTVLLSCRRQRGRQRRIHVLCRRGGGQAVGQRQHQLPRRHAAHAAHGLHAHAQALQCDWVGWGGGIVGVVTGTGALLQQR